MDHDCAENIDNGHDCQITPEYVLHYRCTVCNKEVRFDTKSGKHAIG